MCNLPGTFEERLAQVRQWQEEQVARYGFWIDLVIDGGPAPGLVNIHTHGLKQTFGFPDVQIVINIGQRNAMGILHHIASKYRIAATENIGQPYVPGVVYADIATMPTCFVEATECDRPVLRLVVPDKNGSLDKDTMDPLFAKQYTELVS